MANETFWNKDTIAELRRLYVVEKWPTLKIAKHMGVSQWMVNNQRNKMGLPRRGNGYRRFRDDSGRLEMLAKYPDK